MCTAGPSLQPLEDAIRQKFKPALTGRAQPGDAERDLLALPARLGGLGIAKPTAGLLDAYESSQHATEPLTRLIKIQQTELGSACAEVARQRSDDHAKRRKQRADDAKLITQWLDPEMRRAAELASEKGASRWLTVRPLD